MASSKMVVGLCAAGLAVLAAYAYQAQREPRGPAPAPGATSTPVAAAAPAAKPVAVEVGEVRLVAMPDEVSAVGTLASSQSVMVRPEIAGRVSAIGFRDGTEVGKGAVMVRLDDATQRAELAQALASLELARSNATRTEDLFRRKFVSGSARDQASANLRVAEAAVELARARLLRSEIRAPFTGVVGIRRVSIGDYVKEGADLVNLEDLSSLKVDFRVPESNLAQIRTGQSVGVTVDAYEGRSFDAVDEAIDPQVDAQGRALLLRARIDNRERLLRPGLFARVRLVLQDRPSVASIPEEALIPTAEGQYVFVVDEGKARRVEVTTGARRQARVEVRSGLASGMRVVTAGQIKLRDGAAVSVVEPAAPSVAGR
ncbi:MAG: efflux RND transporter periplasmic adaptor subunit [Rhodocyclaceae bacterium]|nr:efflux RND transporter periplasmic adaptor subunit [Rhodocyclaceae bacterium]